MIQVEGLTKSYGPVRALDSVTFQVAHGEIVGLLGPNGAGKTTTMRVLTTYVAKDEGRVSLAGLDLDDDPLAVRRIVGYLPESAPLYHEMRVADYLRFVAKIRGLSPVLRRDRLAAMVETCGLEPEWGRPIGELSKGFRQRVGLAQALLHDPEILVLDEPTSGLDPNQIVEIREVMRRIGHEKTILLSTHILPEAQATCGRVLILNRGKLVADERTDRLVVGEAEEYVVSVKGSGPTARRALEASPGVFAIEEISATGGSCCFRVKGRVADGLTLGEGLFRAAVEAGLVLTEMRQETRSLEDVFKQLTSGESQR
ncbi:MAG: ATP-binding cassette domain-containing protein [Planctomycetota bacterium]